MVDLCKFSVDTLFVIMSVKAVCVLRGDSDVKGTVNFVEEVSLLADNEARARASRYRATTIVHNVCRCGGG